ncbi:MAG: cupin domain-containing protein [Calditrichaeota bacterium]|nr:cupin domain-containing protein [Calditrichota bacterium]
MTIKTITDISVETYDSDTVKGVKKWVLLSEPDGAPNFRMRLFEVKPAGFTPYHQHDYEHEVFILEGEGEVVGEKGTHPISAGQAVLVLPNEWHQFKNTGQVPLKFICVIPMVEEV